VNELPTTLKGAARYGLVRFDGGSSMQEKNPEELLPNASMLPAHYPMEAGQRAETENAGRV
jgi:hypothetical protein